MPRPSLPSCSPPASPPRDAPRKNKAIDPPKPVLAFLGDSFLTAWLAIDYLKKHNLADGVEICGVGSVGHDIARFHDKVKVLAPMTQARKVLRTGLFDLVVASTSCLPTDIVGELK